MNYLELKNQQRDELEKFPICFAFDKKQLEEGMKKLGVTDTNALVAIPGNGFIRKSDIEAFTGLLDRLNNEMEEAMQDRDFLIDAIAYELSNHEYVVTFNHEPALKALGISLDNDLCKECFAVARKRILSAANIQ